MTDNNDWVVEVDAASFQREVIARSTELPVLIDFWADWCEPCKTLGPMLEERARAGRGRFLLAKVNIDQNPELAQALRVQGIPAVFAVVQGQLADGFEGALPPDRLDAFLDRIAPGGPGPKDPVVEARESIEAGRPEEAITLLEEFLGEEPGHAAAALLLTDLLLDAGRNAEAQTRFDALDEAARESAEGKALASRLAFGESSVDLEALEAAARENPEEFDARLELGRALVARKRYAEGLEELLEAVRLDPGGRAVEAKAAMLETFDVLGLEDPIANDYRFKLSLELFA